MTNSVLITGASGLIGSRLTQWLLQKGCRVSHLGRSARSGTVPSYVWDPVSDQFDLAALEGVDTIINLAGAGIADKRWSRKRKEEILDSRVKSASFLAEILSKRKHAVKAVVTASAIGYYGFGKDDQWLTEDDAPGDDFLASVVIQWEKATEEIPASGVRLVKIRIGIVLSSEGGALREIAGPVRFGVGAPLGDGRQLMSWIHIDDLCAMFGWAIENDAIRGAFNGVAPNPVTNREMTQALARQLKRPLWLPPVPGFLLRLLIGEMADLVIYGSRVSSEKATQKGFRFQYPDLSAALAQLFPSR